MTLPFSQDQFLAVMAAYNVAVWPAQWLLAALALAMVALVLYRPAQAGRPVAFGLALLWAWMAIAYHLAFFRSINPAAPLFAGLSLGAALAFLWAGGLRGGLQFRRELTATARLGLVVIALALAGYPAAGHYLGHRYPATPTFGLPCPTTLFTFGLLLMATPDLRKSLIIGPLAWALIGSSAAFILGVTQDLALLAVAAAGVYLLLRRSPPPPPPDRA